MAVKWMHMEENQSVLNADRFDKRRFNEMMDLSQELQKLRDGAAMPMFEPLLGDMWASFYKMKPAVLDEVAESLEVNRMIMDAIMEDPGFEDHRKSTRLNDWASAAGTIKTGEKAHEWLIRKSERNEGLRGLMEQMAAQTQEEQSPENGESDTPEAASELSGKLKETLQENLDSFREAMGQAHEEARQAEEGVKSMLGGLDAGKAEAELKKVPLRDKILLAEKIATDRRMQEIADWAGRFKEAAVQKQKVKQRRSEAKEGVTIGTDIENLLPSEFSLYTHPLTKTDFLRRFSEGETMQFEQKGPEQLNKGPVVLCLDQSDSMSGLDAQSKGFALALMSIAKKQKRDFCIVLFSTRVQAFKYERGEIGAAEIIRLAETYLRGGTDFEQALGEALAVIGESRFKRADIVFVTDGKDRLTDEFLERFWREKKEKSFQVLSLLIGTSRETVESFTDRVVQIEDFDDEGSFTAFEV
ncbi:VWA domain-containing protein [Bhargavaea cecembensis]|uniref:VWA domain-containing protein n=1 Tax=Bhargavaea cecembensis TaxID=394098 RepID=UPI00058BE766|nr:VWA domain-containing protein [Bhargavaea cecembensis]